MDAPKRVVDDRREIPCGRLIHDADEGPWHHHPVGRLDRQALFVQAFLRIVPAGEGRAVRPERRAIDAGEQPKAPELLGDPRPLGAMSAGEARVFALVRRASSSCVRDTDREVRPC